MSGVGRSVASAIGVSVEASFVVVVAEEIVLVEVFLLRFIEDLGLGVKVFPWLDTKVVLAGDLLDGGMARHTLVPGEELWHLGALLASEDEGEENGGLTPEEDIGEGHVVPDEVVTLDLSFNLREFFVEECNGILPGLLVLSVTEARCDDAGPMLIITVDRQTPLVNFGGFEGVGSEQGL